jgi:hypothetical protein
MGLRAKILIRSDLADLVEIHADATGVSVSDVIDQALAAAEPWTDPGIEARKERLRRSAEIRERRLTVQRATQLAKEQVPKVEEPISKVEDVPCRKGGRCKGFFWRNLVRCGHTERAR